MRTGAPIFIVVALVAASGLAVAQSGDPQIEDEEDDVDVQHVVDTSALSAFLPEADVPNEDIETSGDVIQAWFHDETRDTITLTVELANIPNNESFPAPVAEVWTHFVVLQTQYHIEGELASPGEGMPLEPRFQLYENEAPSGTLTGQVDRASNTTTVVIPKAKIGTPEPGDRLSQPYITTHVPQEGLDPAESPVLDYAPSAERVTVSQETKPTEIAPFVLGLGPTLTYGDAYTFGDYPGAGELTVEVGPPAMTLTEDETGEARLTLTNAGTRSETVTLSADAPSRWKIGADTSEVTLPPGATRELPITVEPAPGASGQHLVELLAGSQASGQQAAVLSVTVQQAPEGSTGGGEDPGSTGASGGGDGQGTSLNDDGSTGPSPDTGTQPAGSGEETNASGQNGAPSPGAVLVAATVGLVAWVSTRRRG